MQVKKLHTLLSKFLQDHPDLEKCEIHVDSEIGDITKLGIFRSRNLILILNEDSYLKTKDMEIYEL